MFAERASDFQWSEDVKVDVLAFDAGIRNMHQQRCVLAYCSFEKGRHRVTSNLSDGLLQRDQ